MQPVEIKVVSIGTFSGGSWGGQGKPGETYEFFRVMCPRLRRSTDRSIAALIPFTFISRADAERFATEEAVREQKYKAEKIAEQRRADEIAGIGRLIADTLQRFGIPVASRLVYTDHLAPLDRMTPETAESVRNLGSCYACRDYDARVDGRLYRVRIDTLAGHDSAVVPFEVA